MCLICASNEEQWPSEAIIGWEFCNDCMLSVHRKDPKSFKALMNIITQNINEKGAKIEKNICFLLELTANGNCDNCTFHLCEELQTQNITERLQRLNAGLGKVVCGQRIKPEALKVISRLQDNQKTY